MSSDGSEENDQLSSSSASEPAVNNASHHHAARRYFRGLTHYHSSNPTANSDDPPDELEHWHRRGRALFGPVSDEAKELIENARIVCLISPADRHIYRVTESDNNIFVSLRPLHCNCSSYFEDSVVHQTQLYCAHIIAVYWAYARDEVAIEDTSAEDLSRFLRMLTSNPF